MSDNGTTLRFTKLLLSTDGSENSEGAIREAIALAKRSSAKMTAISVVETNPEFDALAPQIIEQKEKVAREHLEVVQRRAQQDGVACDIIVYEGEDTYQYIVDEAMKSSHPMIVMGRRGRTGLKRLMMGSVTSRVIGHASCNVLVVPKAASVDCDRIVVATDGSPYSQAAAAEAIALAKLHGGRLIAVSVTPTDAMAPTGEDVTFNQRELLEEKEMFEASQHARKVKEAAIQQGVAAEAYVMNGRPFEAIVQAAQDAKAGLIVLGSHGRTGVEKLLMGSVAERVVGLASCPVLVVKS